MPVGEWEEPLERWTSAGLISGDQAAAIRTFESGRSLPSVGSRARDSRDRFTGTEALVYAGSAAIVGGLVYLVASSTSTGGQAAVATSAGIAGLGGAAALAAGQGPRDVLGSGRRAAAVCAAASIASLAAGLSLLSVARGWLVTTTTSCVPDPCFTAVDHRANAIFGAAVALAFALVVLERLRAGILALLLVAAAYTTSLTSVSRFDNPGPTMYSVGAMATGAFLAVVALRAVEVREPLFFTALILPLALLFLTDGPDHVGAGGVAAGVAAAIALALAVRVDSNGLAVAGGLGIFGFCVDVTARSFGGSSPALVLIVSGLALVGCALLVQRALRRNRSAAA